MSLKQLDGQCNCMRQNATLPDDVCHISSSSLKQLWTSTVHPDWLVSREKCCSTSKLKRLIGFYDVYVHIMCCLWLTLCCRLSQVHENDKPVDQGQDTPNIIFALLKKRPETQRNARPAVAYARANDCHNHYRRIAFLSHVARQASEHRRPWLRPDVTQSPLRNASGLDCKRTYVGIYL